MKYPKIEATEFNQAFAMHPGHLAGVLQIWIRAKYVGSKAYNRYISCFLDKRDLLRLKYAVDLALDIQKKSDSEKLAEKRNIGI